MHVSGSDLFKIACRRPCGATSIITASSGMYLQPSSKYTGLIRLFVKYSAEQALIKGVSHSDSGADVHIHFEERFFGF